MIVARSRHRKPQQLRVLVNALYHCGKERKELHVLHGRLARIEQILTVIGGKRPVVVLAGAIHSVKRLFVQQAHHSVTQRRFLHDLHCELVLVGCRISAGEYRRHFMLCGSNFVVLCLGHYSEPPERIVKIPHIRMNTAVDRAKVVVVHFLTLERRSSEQRSSGVYEILALLVNALVYEEVFLLRTHSGINALRGGVAKKTEYAHSLLGKRVHRTQQRSLLVKRLAGIRAECGGYIESTVLYERAGSRIPRCIAARLESCTDTAGWK